MSDSMELLAPGGNPSGAMAALDAGADAVYCGLQKFNARERSENFTPEELGRFISYAHKNGRRVYVTFNTLLKESELKEASVEMARLALMRPDAVIVQDPGAALMIRKYFPDLTLHASTQMGFHNSAGLEFARDFGFKRVILERQVTLEEIRSMKKKVPDVELELFVHGALCCCLSGSCLFSSYLGGWSGNRGKCKQPCRRLYFKDGADPAYDRGEFLFSPDDLCALELIRDFREIGVCSLKIEGRLRRADYVGKVVRAYRTVLDAPECDYKEALKEAQEILRSVNTRKYSLGFYTESSIKKLVRLDSVGGSGRPCGEVERSVPGGFEALMHSRLHVGDTIRVQKEADSSDSFNATVLYLEKDSRKVMKVLAGERCFIRCDKKPLRGSLIYRTGESSADYTARLEKLPPAKRLLDLKIFLTGTQLKVEAASQVYLKTLSLQPAQKRPLEAETLKKEFSSSASGIYETGTVHAEVQGEWFLPGSVLKDLRREFFAWAETHLNKEYRKEQILAALRKFRDEYNVLHASPAERMGDYTAPGKEYILEPFVPEGKLESLREKVALLIRQGVNVFRLTHLFHFALFPEEMRRNVILKTMVPLPVCNSYSVLACRQAGAAACQAFVELGQGDCEDMLSHSVLPLEYYTYGRPGIFSTRAVLPYWKRFSDVKGNFFRMEKEGALTVLYPDEVLLRETPAGFSSFTDLRHARAGEENISVFNADREWA